MITIVLTVNPIITPRTFNFFAACEAAMASCTLPAAYSESTYVNIYLTNNLAPMQLTFSEYEIAAIPKHIQQNRKLMRENAM